MRTKNIIFTALLLLFSLKMYSNSAGAEPFYNGKTITIIVATKPGGGYDFYGRLIGKFMHLRAFSLTK